jgi:sulfur carrier protein
MGKIKVNDEVQEVALPLTLTELIRSNNVFQPEMVSVQINGTFVERENFDTTAISDGDEVDFLYFMGGGK